MSLVDGFNAPLAITNNVGCHVASCPVDLDAICEFTSRSLSSPVWFNSLTSAGPDALKGPTNSSGAVLGCKSACDANIGGDSSESFHVVCARPFYASPGDSPNCCSGSYGTAAMCPSSGVDYYSFFSASPVAAQSRVCALTPVALHRGQLSRRVCVCVR